MNVVTIEPDPDVRDISRMTPWSRTLFSYQNISSIYGDCATEIEVFDAESFDAILHDPPALDLAVEIEGDAP